MGNNIKKIDIKEFREKGYLQEVNRMFLHPLGLVLSVSVDDNANEKLDGIWDYRDDEEGIIYDIANSDTDRQNRFKKNISFISDELEGRKERRKEILGFDIEKVK